jgi:hypothetical protein
VISSNTKGLLTYSITNDAEDDSEKEAICEIFQGV